MNESHSEHGITTPGHIGHPEHNITIPGGPAGSPLHFTPEEWQQFRDSDLGAARSVVLLMTGIFTTGFILYATIDYLIW
jgi:hypothetical protein